MKLFASKEAELIAYMDHNGWGLEDAVALNMLRMKKFTSEEAAQLLLVSRRTGRPIEAIMHGVFLLRMTHSFANIRVAMEKMQ